MMILHKTTQYFPKRGFLSFDRPPIYSIEQDSLNIKRGIESDQYIVSFSMNFVLSNKSARFVGALNELK